MESSNEALQRPSAFLRQNQNKHSTFVNFTLGWIWKAVEKGKAELSIAKTDRFC